MFRGDDIILALRHEGTFTEIFELENYPCDQQALTITLNFNTRLTGPVPLELAIAEDCVVSMECVELCPPAKEWRPEREMLISPHVIGTGDRQFPAVSFTAKVDRQPSMPMWGSNRGLKL